MTSDVTDWEYDHLVKTLEDRIKVPSIVSADITVIPIELPFLRDVVEHLVRSQREIAELKKRYASAYLLVDPCIELYEAWDKDWPHVNKMLAVGRLAREHRERYGGAQISDVLGEPRGVSDGSGIYGQACGPDDSDSGVGKEE